MKRAGAALQFKGSRVQRREGYRGATLNLEQPTGTQAL